MPLRCGGIRVSFTPHSAYSPTVEHPYVHVLTCSTKPCKKPLSSFAAATVFSVFFGRWVAPSPLRRLSAPNAAAPEASPLAPRGPPRARPWSPSNPPACGYVATKGCNGYRKSRGRGKRSAVVLSRADILIAWRVPSFLDMPRLKQVSRQES